MEHSIDELRWLRLHLTHESITWQDWRQVGICVCRFPRGPRLSAEFHGQQALAADGTIDRAPAFRTARQARWIPVLLIQVDAGKPAPDNLDAAGIFLGVRRIDSDLGMQALVARVDQRGDRHPAFEDRLILVGLRDAIPGFVAPVVEKGARSRSVVLPKGEWKAENGTIHQGGGKVKIEVPLQRLPYFMKI
jgi:hypothetical protein